MFGHSNCQFEWFSHEDEARKAGLSEQSIETLRHGGGTFQAEDEQAIHDYAVELLRDHRASDATYRRILAAHGTAGIVELTALIGYYAMVALTLNAHEIGVPEGASAAAALARQRRGGLAIASWTSDPSSA